MKSQKIKNFYIILFLLCLWPFFIGCDLYDTKGAAKEALQGGGESATAFGSGTVYTNYNSYRNNATWRDKIKENGWKAFGGPKGETLDSDGGDSKPQVKLRKKDCKNSKEAQERFNIFIEDEVQQMRLNQLANLMTVKVEFRRHEEAIRDIPYSLIKRAIERVEKKKNKKITVGEKEEVKNRLMEKERRLNNVKASIDSLFFGTTLDDKDLDKILAKIEDYEKFKIDRTVFRDLRTQELASNLNHAQLSATKEFLINFKKIPQSKREYLLSVKFKGKLKARLFSIFQSDEKVVNKGHKDLLNSLDNLKTSKKGKATVEKAMSDVETIAENLGLKPGVFGGNIDLIESAISSKDKGVYKKYKEKVFQELKNIALKEGSVPPKIKNALKFYRNFNSLAKSSELDAPMGELAEKIMQHSKELTDRLNALRAQKGKGPLTSQIFTVEKKLCSSPSIMAAVVRFFKDMLEGGCNLKNAILGVLNSGSDKSRKELLMMMTGLLRLHKIRHKKESVEKFTQDSKSKDVDRKRDEVVIHKLYNDYEDFDKSMLYLKQHAQSVRDGLHFYNFINQKKCKYTGLKNLDQELKNGICDIASSVTNRGEVNRFCTAVTGLLKELHYSKSDQDSREEIKRTDLANPELW